MGFRNKQFGRFADFLAKRAIFMLYVWVLDVSMIHGHAFFWQIGLFSHYMYGFLDVSMIHEHAFSGKSGYFHATCME
jgi:hypothetical protein